MSEPKPALIDGGEAETIEVETCRLEGTWWHLAPTFPSVLTWSLLAWGAAAVAGIAGAAAADWLGLI